MASSGNVNDAVKSTLREYKERAETADAMKLTKAIAVDKATERMTDASKYTGSHKERFDADGKGKGMDGRVDKVDGSGYVGNYKNAGTYDKKH